MLLTDIHQALKEGKTMHWSNTGYCLVLDNCCPLGIGVLCIQNDWYTGLEACMTKQCFIEGQAA